MDKKLTKSMVVTGLAATTVLSAATTQQVKAEEATKRMAEQAETKASKPAETPVTKEAVLAAKTESENQEELVQKAQEASQQAKEMLDEATKEETDTKELLDKATETTIQEAKDSLPALEAQISTEEANVEIAQTEVETAQTEVSKEENVVSGQESLVDMAQTAVNEAKKPIHEEEEALKQAQAAVAQAEKEVAEKTAVLKAAQTDSHTIPEKINQTTQEIREGEKNLASLEKNIQQTETALKQAESQATPTRHVDLKTATYQEFLTHLQKNGANADVKAEATKALGIYQRGQKEDGIVVGTDVNSPATLANNLKAVEVMKAINAYRKRAGLPELLVDPYANVGSQIQTRYFEKAGTHMFKYANGENVAISFSPQDAVKFWYNEKALYQKYAAQYGLPTDERQIDAYAILNKVGMGIFAQVGHYLQIVNNTVNTMSAAYDTQPNRYSNVYGTAEAAFYSVSDVNRRLANGTLMTVEDFEKALRNYAGSSTAPSPQVTALKNNLAMLKVQKTNQESTLNMKKATLRDLQSSLNNQVATTQKATAALMTAQAIFAKAKQVATEKQGKLDVARQSIQRNLAPKEKELETALKNLEQSKNQLASLKSTLAAKQKNLEQAKGNLATAKQKLEEARNYLARLEQAPLLHAKAVKALAEAQTDYDAKQALLEQESEKLIRLQTTYKQLESEYRRLHPQIIPQSQGTRVLKPAGLQNNPGRSGVQNLGNQGRALAASGLATASSQTSGAKSAPSMGQAKYANTFLPSTGGSASSIAAMGLLLGAATLAAAGLKKEER
ncbi:CAP domain-containing protein [Streptococcus himalayensis]|uniref:Secretion protein n=1 Tax=Streptococcus himalayensis TaxID=1888195 RepID=A0A917AA25_9STRE|nr:CAP domain-containing protein [Streptococcus himalayensis]GGE38166.1 secretion protein [Streptococcus himalayensis]